MALWMHGLAGLSMAAIDSPAGLSMGLSMAKKFAVDGPLVVGGPSVA